MVYEKKVEPLTKREVILCGFLLILFVIILEILPWAAVAADDVEDLLKLDVSSVDDVYKYHSWIKDNRSWILFGATCLLLGYPIILCHIHYVYRISQTLWSCLSIDLLVLLNIASWLMVATIYCVVLPALLIFVAYYDWEFTDGYQYQGYAMQFQLGHFLYILFDAVLIPMGLTASIPWIGILVSLFGGNKSSHWEISQDDDDDNNNQHIGVFMNCPGLGRVLLVLFLLFLILLSLFGSFGTAFDYSKEGFFSYSGDGQWLYIVLFISWIILGLMYIHLGCNLEKEQEFLNKRVKPAHKTTDKVASQPVTVSTVVPVEPSSPSSPAVPAVSGVISNK